MTPKEIRESLQKQNIKIAHLAAALNVTPAQIYNVIRGDTNSKRIHQAIAKLINQPVDVVFPKRAVVAQASARAIQRNKRAVEINKLRNQLGELAACA